jgi:hypothetical protein
MKTNEGLIRSSKCVGELDKVITLFDKELRVSQHLGIHNRASSEKDKKIITQQLNEANVFAYCTNRQHKHIKTKHSTIFPPFKKDAFMKRTKEHILDLRTKISTEI